MSRMYRWIRHSAAALSAGAVAFAFSGPVQAQNQPTPPPSAKEAKDNTKEAKDSAKDAANQAKDAANKGGQAAKDNANAAKDKANQAKESAKDSTQPAKNQLNKEADQSRDNARDNSRESRNNSQQSTQNARDYGRDTSRDARNQRDLNTNDNRDRNTARDQDRNRDNQDARYQDRNRDTQNRDARNDNRDRDSAPDSRTFRADNIRSADVGIWFDRGARDGLVISDLSTNGAIAKFGFHEGDRIVSVNDHRVNRESDFTNYLFADNIRNDRVKVVVLRDNAEEVVYVQPNALVDEYSNVETDPLQRYGIVLDDRYDDRIVVWKVIPRSPAYYAGIRAGDVLVTFRGQPLTTRNEFVRVATDLGEGSVPVQVRRGDRTRDYAVDVPAYTSGERRMAMRPNLDADRVNERREARVEDRRDNRTNNRQDNQNNDRPATPLRPRR
jgi:C-terminal processing protease CtpA/Prc